MALIILVRKTFLIFMKDHERPYNLKISTVDLKVLV
jgi:hypothetical protein